MMNKHTPFVPLLVLVCSTHWTATCGPAAWVRVQSLIAKSDVIVVATTAQGALSNGVASATLIIDRTLKGGVPEQSSFAVTWKLPPNAQFRSRPLPPRHGLFFLQKAGASWSIVPAIVGDFSVEEVYFFLPAGEPPQPFAASAGSVLDQILLLLSWAQEAGVPPGGAAVNLVGEYRDSRSDALKQVFARFSQNPSPGLAATGIAGLLASGDVHALQRVEAQQSTLMEAPGAGLIVDELKWHFPVSENGAMEILGRLVTNQTTEPQLKEAAAGCLARLHTRQVLPYLAGLLQSPSPTLRAYAVGAFSSFANNVPPGSHEPAPGEWRYRTPETISHSAMDPRHAAFWFNWWLANQSDITQGR